MPFATFRKIGWFIAIWLMSVAVLGIVAYAIRLVLYG
jgi:hypothetical protein